MQTTYYAAKAIEDHLFDSASKSTRKRRVRAEKAEKAQEKVWATVASRPAVSPS
jgi:ribosomal protein L20A (L18A)